MATWIVGAVVAAAVAAILWKMIRDRKAHKGGCGCDCSHCSGCNH